MPLSCPRSTRPKGRWWDNEAESPSAGCGGWGSGVALGLWGGMDGILGCKARQPSREGGGWGEQHDAAELLHAP